MSEDIGETSDGYHTFNELYEHRHALFGLVVKLYGGWKARRHFDNTEYVGWFIAGLIQPHGKQITYHIPMKYWEDFPGEAMEKAPTAWDGHGPSDVVERLKGLWK